MGAYLSEAELRIKYGSSEIDLTTGALDAEQASQSIEAAINTAEATVNGYASSRYSLPLVEGDLLKQLVASIARFVLNANLASVRVTEDHDRAISMLKDIAARRLNLAGNSEQTAANAAAGGSSGSAFVGGGDGRKMDLSGYP